MKQTHSHFPRCSRHGPINILYSGGRICIVYCAHWDSVGSIYILSIGVLNATYGEDEKSIKLIPENMVFLQFYSGGCSMNTCEYQNRAMSVTWVPVTHLPGTQGRDGKYLQCEQYCH